MDPEQARLLTLPQQERRDIAVSNKRLRRFSKGRRVEPIDQSMATIAATRAHDRVNFGIPNKLHEFVRATRV
jgi:hypothetical protein